MTVPSVEARIIAAFGEARVNVHANRDLYERVHLSLGDARERRRFRWRLALLGLAFVLANAALALALSDYEKGRFTMPWWVLELITDIVLVALAIGLGPFIKRFGRAYAADVFRANPRTGKSYLVLTDVAYYLIFSSFVLFTMTFVMPSNWRESTGEQLEYEVGRVGGILLIMGVLHALNVVALPVIGQLLSSRRLHADPTTAAPASPNLGPGTWLLRIEPAGGAHETSDAAEPPH